MSRVTAAVPRIPISRVCMDDREAEAARRPLLAGWVTQGPEVAAFEREFAAYVGADHACAVSNCTTALALLTVGVRPGDEVVTVSHSFIATANSIRHCVRLPQNVNQQDAMQALLERGIATRRGVMCAHREPAYASESCRCDTGNQQCGCAAGHCECLIESETATDRCILLPLYPQLTDAEQLYVADSLRAVCQ